MQGFTGLQFFKLETRSTLSGPQEVTDMHIHYPVVSSVLYFHILYTETELASQNYLDTQFGLWIIAETVHIFV